MEALGESGKSGHAESARGLEVGSGSSVEKDLGVEALLACVVSRRELPVYS